MSTARLLHTALYGLICVHYGTRRGTRARTSNSTRKCKVETHSQLELPERVTHTHGSLTHRHSLSLTRASTLAVGCAQQPHGHMTTAEPADHLDRDTRQGTGEADQEAAGWSVAQVTEAHCRQHGAEPLSRVSQICGRHWRRVSCVSDVCCC